MQLGIDYSAPNPDQEIQADRYAHNFPMIKDAEETITAEVPFTKIEYYDLQSLADHIGIPFHRLIRVSAFNFKDNFEKERV